MYRCAKRLIAVAAVVCLPALAVAQQPAGDSDTARILDRLTQIHGALERIADSLEGQLDGQRLDLMLKRLEVSERRVAPLEEQVRKAQAERSLLQDREERAELQLSEMADRIAAGELELSDSEAEAAVAQMELDLEQFRSRISELDGQLAGLENELTRVREGIRDWQDYVDRELADR
jgi:chromosome segregation ATPase